jgi:hypothetical protein
MGQSFVVQDRLEKYCRIPLPLVDAMADRRISANALLVYVTLDHHCNRQTGKCWPGLRCISSMSGLSINTVRRMLADLERQKFITVLRPDNQRQPTIYTLLYGKAYGTPRDCAKSDTVLKPDCIKSSINSRSDICDTQPSEPPEPLRIKTPLNPKKDSEEGARCAPRAVVSLHPGERT